MIALSELDPRWIHPHMFIFKCPHCRSVWLTCKSIAMERRETWDILKAGLGEDWNEKVVPPCPKTSWNIASQEFEGMTVTPSIDASASGHWHGSITNGRCV